MITSKKNRLISNNLPLSLRSSRAVLFTPITIGRRTDGQSTISEIEILNESKLKVKKSSDNQFREIPGVFVSKFHLNKIDEFNVCTEIEVENLTK